MNTTEIKAAIETLRTKVGGRMLNFRVLPVRRGKANVLTHDGESVSVEATFTEIKAVADSMGILAIED